MRHTFRASLLAVVLAAAMIPAASVHADVRPHVYSSDPVATDDLGELLKVYATDDILNARCGDPSPTPVPDGEPIVVSIPPVQPFTVGAIPAAYWRNPPSRDPGWRLTFWSLAFL